MNTRLDIRQFVDRAPIVVQESAPLQEALRLMSTHGIGAVLVVRDGDLVGILTERDLVRIVPSGGPDLVSEPVGKHMTPDPTTVDVRDRFHEVYEKMKRLHVRHLPILENGELIGMVSMRDLINTYQNFLVDQYESARLRLREMEILAELGTNDRVAELVNELDMYKQLSMTDSLTGLYNKRYFTARLTEEIARTRRYHSRLALIFADIDLFKKVNDEFGHATGDEVLRQIGKVFSAAVDTTGVVSRLRKSDIVARYGGEEFVVILPETDLDGAHAAAEKLRQSVEEQTFYGGVRITVSFGVAELREDDTDGEELIRSADAALYRAKNAGRNRVE